MQELNLAIKERFDAEKIEFAFPTQTIYVKQDSDWPSGIDLVCQTSLARLNQTHGPVLA